MNACELKMKFIAVRNYEPADVNELLDFARQAYLRGQISIAEYRDIIRELETLGAHKPDYQDEYIGL
jgi:hypothetical protein